MTDNKVLMIALVAGAIYFLSKKTSSAIPSEIAWGPATPEVGQHQTTASGQEMIWTGVAWVPYP